MRAPASATESPVAWPLGSARVAIRPAPHEQLARSTDREPPRPPLPYTVGSLPRLDELRRRLVDDLGAQLRAGQIDWKTIDRMPMPDDLDAGRP